LIVARTGIPGFSAHPLSVLFEVDDEVVFEIAA
jgi:hypothetical protein